jgi:hypothetical protein
MVCLHKADQTVQQKTKNAIVIDDAFMLVELLFNILLRNARTVWCTSSIAATFSELE